jgi:hypothetical protein
MGVEEAIKRLNDEYQQAPLNFPVEQAVQARLVELLRENFTSTLLARAGFRDDETTKYKQKYLKRIAKPQEISPVQAEINFGFPTENKRLDIAILRPSALQNQEQLDYLPSVEEQALTIRLVDGTKYYPVDAIKHAIEIKYIKNVDIAGSRLERDSIDEWPYFDRDLRKLSELDDTDSRHLIVFTNKNPFQKGEQDKRGTKKAQRRFQRVSSECAQRDITLSEIHPR